MNQAQQDLGQGFNNIEQIRELLFGNQLKQLSTQLEGLEAALKEHQEDTNKRITALKVESDRSLQKSQQTLSTEFQTAIRSLSEDVKSMKEKDSQDKNEIEQQIESISKRLSTNVATLDEAIDKQTRSLRDDVLSSHKKLQSDLIQMKTQLLEGFEKRMSSLTSSKVNREEIAEMFFEIGLKLKGTDQLQLKGSDFPSTWDESSDKKKSEYLLLEDSEENK
jgi:gas vesicle protein